MDFEIQRSDLHTTRFLHTDPNVWGYARVEDSRHADLAPGMRVYGYLPCASHLLVVPDRVNQKGFIDAAPHRATLPSAYQGYRDVETDPVYSAGLEAEHI